MRSNSRGIYRSSTITLFMLLLVISCSCEKMFEDTNYLSVEQVLDEKRLIEIHRSPKFKGTGGPEIPLPNGTTVKRDTIFEAIQPLVKEGRSICPSLVKALKSDKTHVRYGAYLALRLITKSEILYYPFFAPSDPKNIKGYKQWESFVKTLSED